MSITVDARGLACPEPVIRTKRAIEKGNENEIEVLVDNDAALENIRRLAKGLGCTERFEQIKDTNGYRIFISKSKSCEIAAINSVTSVSGPTIVVISSNTMGKGDDDLGAILMKAFLHALTELSSVPDKIVLYNSGVKLSVKGSPTVQDLKSLIDKGSSVIVCGTCLNFFGLTEIIGAGTISNMYDIAESLLTSGRIVCP